MCGDGNILLVRVVVLARTGFVFVVFVFVGERGLARGVMCTVATQISWS